MPRITFQQVAKSWNGVPALHPLTLTMDQGEYLTVIGPSGSGKTTWLRLLAGLEQPDQGRILFDNQDITQTPAGERGIAMVFQGQALFPHLSIRENLGLHLKLRRIPLAETTTRVEEIARQLELTRLLDRLPEQLSGGEQQRVAIGRALVSRPKVLLLDEPLSHLDAPQRIRLRTELRRSIQDPKLTVIHVTHDQREALALGHRVAVLNQGRLEQLAPPKTIHHEPATLFVARFMGDPAMNLWQTPAGHWLGVRPEHLTPQPRAGEEAPLLQGEILHSEFTGRESWIVFDGPAGPAIALAPPDQPRPHPGQLARFWAAPEQIHRFSEISGLREGTGPILSE